ncbi:hypothetical protein GmHk_14G041692 [Glycine max]|nr:hypothetical protein GmHk_14G041692 [Glycine max]
MAERKGPPSPTRDHRMLLDALSQRMNQVLREHTKGMYERLESLENQNLNWENEKHGDMDRHEFEAPLVTSWTEENPGRRFYGCCLYKDTGRRGCNFFQWHDPVGNNRQKKIIVGLMKEVDELKLREKDLQTMISEMKMKEKCLWIVLVVCWVCICFLLCLLCSR